MTEINRIIKKHKFLFIFFAVYLLARVFLININYTEWGDTFRMIRGADYLSRLSWPWDEKRWPFYSLLLVPGIWLNAPVLWGRFLSLLASAWSLLLVYRFYLDYISNNIKYALTAVIITAVSSVFAYWSLRVMADPVFTLLILLFFFYSIRFYKEGGKDEAGSSQKVIILSFLLLCITMTRLEGLFAAAGIGVYLIFRKHLRDLMIFAIPQIFIYVPWTVYAKFIYHWETTNNYFDEVQTFSFDSERLKYFLAYTLFILVLPVLTYYILIGLKSFLGNSKNKGLYLPLGVFIGLELIIGFVWIPSLPRIYLPLVPLFAMLAVYGIEKLNLNKINTPILLLNLFLLSTFTALQYKYKLYFLGASKIIFAVVIISSFVSIFYVFWPVKFRKRIYLVSLVLFINFLTSGIVIYNQHLVYKTVKQGIDFVVDRRGIVAYSDETGNTEWYLKRRSIYMDSVKDFQIEDPDQQYRALKNYGVSYLLWTNEFNRGFSAIDPESDSRYQLLVEYKQTINDPLDEVLGLFGVVKRENPQVFVTKVYEIR